MCPSPLLERLAPYGCCDEQQPQDCQHVRERHDQQVGRPGDHDQQYHWWDEPGCVPLEPFEHHEGESILAVETTFVDVACGEEQAQEVAADEEAIPEQHLGPGGVEEPFRKPFGHRVSNLDLSGCECALCGASTYIISYNRLLINLLP